MTILLVKRNISGRPFKKRLDRSITKKAQLSNKVNGMKVLATSFDGFPYKSNHVLLVRRQTVGDAHPHAAETEGRIVSAVSSQFAFLR